MQQWPISVRWTYKNGSYSRLWTLLPFIDSLVLEAQSSSPCSGTTSSDEFHLNSLIKGRQRGWYLALDYFTVGSWSLFLGNNKYFLDRHDSVCEGKNVFFHFGVVITYSMSIKCQVNIIILKFSKDNTISTILRYRPTCYFHYILPLRVKFGGYNNIVLIQ